MTAPSPNGSTPPTPSKAAAAAFGAWLRAELDRRGWDGVELAERAGVWRSAAYRWRSGRLRPDPDNCRRIAAALGLDPDAVLAAAGHRPADPAAAGAVRRELAELIARVPEELLVPLVPMLRALADPPTQRETRARLRARLGKGEGR